MSMYWTSRRRAQTYRDSGCLIWNSVIRCWTLTTLREQVAGSCNVLAWRKSYHVLLHMITRTSLVTSSHSLMTCADCQSQCLKCIVSLKIASSLFRWAKLIYVVVMKLTSQWNTIKIDCKTTGGYVGFSANFATTQRWVLNESRRDMFRKRLREHLSITPEKTYFYKELAPARIKTDLGPVEKVVDLLQNIFSTIPRRKRGRSYKSVYRLVLQQLQKYAMICFKPERRGMGAVGWR